MEAGARKAAVVVTALALMGAAVTLLALRPWGPASPDAPPRAAAEQVEAPHVEARPGLAPALKPASKRSNTASEADQESAMPGEPAAADSAESGFVVKGTLKFTSGSEVNGRVELWLALREDDEVIRESKFEGGAFEIRLPKPGRYRVWSLEIDGRDVDPIPPDVEVKEGVSIDLVTEEAKPAVLQILDAATGRPLHDAKAYDERTTRGKPHAADPDGLIRLPSAWGTSQWFVIAPAKAWVKVDVPQRGTDPLPIRLSAGGALRLTVPHWSQLQTPTISIGPEGGTPEMFPPPDANGSVLIEGLPTGRLVVSVCRGEWFLRGEVYGSATVEVRAGDTTNLAVDASVRAIKKPIAAKGTLTVPRAWGITRVTLHLEGVEEGTSGSTGEVDLVLAPDEPASFAFDPVPPGRYNAYSYEPDATWPIVVVEGGPPIDLALSEPCTAEVRVTDAATGRPIEGTRVSWGVPRPSAGGGMGWAGNEVEFDAQRGLCVFRAPAGPVKVDSYQVEGYCRVSLDVVMVPGDPAKVEMRLVRAATIVVHLLLDGKPYVSAKECGAIIGPPDEEQEGGVSEYGSTRTGEMRVGGRAPGPTKIDLDDIDGFEPVEPKIVDLRGGETTEVVFVLKRKP